MTPAPRDDRSGGIVRWARWLTGLWLVLGASIAWSKRETIPGLALNDIGDTLAGFCAPIAFLWLVVTALLQKSELEAQREEIRQNREALLAQVRQLDSSVAEQAAQTRIMKEDYERSLQASLNAQLRRILIDDHSWYMSELSGLGPRRLDGMAGGAPITLAHDFTNAAARLIAENRVSEAIIGIDAELGAITALVSGDGRDYGAEALALIGTLGGIIEAFHHALAAAVESGDQFQRNAVAAADYELGVVGRIARLDALARRLRAIGRARPD